jgi:hypothetical protein
MVCIDYAIAVLLLRWVSLVLFRSGITRRSPVHFVLLLKLDLARVGIQVTKKQCVLVKK